MLCTQHGHPPMGARLQPCDANHNPYHVVQNLNPVTQPPTHGGPVTACCKAQECALLRERQRLQHRPARHNDASLCTNNCHMSMR